MNIQRNKNILTISPSSQYKATKRDQGVVENFNILPSILKGTTQYTSQDFRNDLDFLDRKLNQVHRDVNYWDIYKISAAVTDPNLFQSVWNSLTPNSALVINTSSITIGDQTFNRGDIVLKSNDGSQIIIRAENGGIYYPSSLTVEGNKWTLGYSFTQGQTIAGNVSVNVSGGSSTNAVASPYENINFTGIVDQSNQSIYGYDLSFDKTQLGNGIRNWGERDGQYFCRFEVSSYQKEGGSVQKIRPIISFYYLNNGAQERLYIPYNLIEVAEGAGDQQISYWEIQVQTAFAEMLNGVIVK